MKRSVTVFLLCFAFCATQAQQEITGRVLDEQDDALPGVNVLIKGTNSGTVTDFDGNFTIRASKEDVLTFSFVGYARKEVVVGAQTSITVSMELDISQLSEVVIIGYGTATKKDLVSSVAQVKAEEIQNQPVVRLDQVLQGRATGVEVTSNNGAPGAAATIRIRGNSSINGNNNPLYVVDGLITGVDFDLNSLNVNDIESVEVLKDATALSIYGTRGAAGVILVTTKNGSSLPAGKPTITINQYYTTQSVANEIEIMGGQDYLNYINEAGQFVPGPLVTVGDSELSLGITDDSLPLLFPDPSSVPTTDWLDLITQRGAISNTDVSISGNSENVNYYVSVNYFDQEGIVKNSGIERLTVRTNLDVNPSDKFKTGLRLNVSNFRRENNKVNFSGTVTSVLPIRSVYDDDGNFTNSNPVSGVLQRNPVADLQLREDHNLVTNIIGNYYAEYELFEGFKLKTTLGAELSFNKANDYRSGALPERLANNEGGLAFVNDTYRKNLLNENTFLYEKSFNIHSLKVLGGFTWQKVTSETSESSAEGFPNDAVTFNNLALGSNPDTYVVGSGYDQRTLASFLGRINYGYAGKYLLTVVGRYDGSSVFEEGNKWGFFPSVGAAWNVDQEGFFDALEVFSSAKIRGSYGVVGEQGVDTYNSIDIFRPQNTYFNEALVGAVILDRVASRGLKWERTEQLDIGLEVGFWGERLSLEVDYYNKTTRDLLLNRELPTTAGGPQLQNVGSVRNKGFEFLLNTINVDKRDFRWETTLTVSANRSEVLDLGGEEFITLQSTGNQGGASARIIVGEPLPVFFGAEYLGTYKTAEEIIADGRENISFLGSPRFRDRDGNSVINVEDFVVLGTPQPDFYGGIRNKFSYKGLTLDIFFHGQYGGEIFNIFAQRGFYGRGDENLLPELVGRWREGVNEGSDIPRAGTSTSVFNPNSDVNVEDGSFLRLRQLTLGYDLPLNKFGADNLFKNIYVYISGTNLWLISDFRLGDPEVNNFTAGSGFGSVSQGFSSGVYPYATSFTVGATVTF
ncbi:TonB-dependent receptor [Fulvivirga sp. M361]|uniref:SusC/RagA family TonB-linked outer membrane protein n=1 Tax=Fulvivirga sp. M361 TaxID=2594266 RepID=UPI00162383DC|nr:TonB-dependent receptor [Fulvivirga sp. M361]